MWSKVGNVYGMESDGQIFTIQGVYGASESTMDGASQVYDESEIEALVEGLRDPRSTLLGVPFPTKFAAWGNDG